MIRKALAFIFKGPVLLAILVIAGVVLWWLRPAWVLKNGQRYKVGKRQFKEAMVYTVFDSDPDTLFSVRYSFLRKEAACSYLNMNTGRFSEMYYYSPSVAPGLACKANGNYWYLLQTYDGHYYLASALKDNNHLSSGYKEIFFNQRLASLVDDYAYLHDFPFYLKHPLFDEIEEPYRFVETELGTSLVLRRDVYDSITAIAGEDVLHSDGLIDLAKGLTKLVQEDVTAIEAWCIVQQMRMFHWQYQRRQNDPDYILADAYFLGTCDLNNDESDELIIGIGSSRYLEGYVLAYDLKQDRLLWSFPMSGFAWHVHIQDIDDDDSLEIIFGKQAGGQEYSPWWFEIEDYGSTGFSEIIILDKDGKQKYVNGVKCRYRTGYFGSLPLIQPLEDGKLLVAVSSYHGLPDNHLKVLDTHSGRIDILDIAIGNPVAMNQTDEGISVYHCDSTNVYRDVLDDELNLKYRYKSPIEHPFLWVQTCLFQHDGEQFLATSPLSIYNSKMNPIINESTNIVEHISYHNNNLYYGQSISGSDRFYLNRLSFEPNTAPNMYAVIIWLAMIALVLVYWLTRSLVSLPFEIVEGNYAILYDVLSLFFIWRIIGFQSVFTRKHGASLNRRKFSELLKDLSDEQKNLFTRNLGFIRIQYYKFHVDNEMHIVQRIAHDIKNQLHHINIQVAEEAENDRLSQVSSTIDEIYQKTSMLSDFSRINLLKRQPIDLINILDDIIFGYAAHPRSADIVLDTVIESVIINADNDLIRIALRNLIENAMKYSPEDTPITISLNIDSQKLLLKIFNTISGTSEFTQDHPKSSGIGLDISRRIIQSHEGIMETDFTAPNAELTISLPITEDKHGK